MKRVKKSKILTPVLYSIASGYQKQLDKYKIMLKLAEKQKEYVESGEMGRVEEVISARQKLIYELHEMNIQLKPLREDIMGALNLKEFSSSAIKDALPIKAADELADKLREIGNILYAIKEVDIINEKLLKATLNGVDQQIKKIQKQSMAKKAYKKKKAAEPGNKIDKSK